MAKYKFTGTIVVDGVRSKREAIETLQTMLNDYTDNNFENAKGIGIKWDSLEKVPEPSNSDRREMPWDYGKHFD